MSKPIRISGRQVAEWGPMTAQLAQDTIRQAIEEKTGRKWEWKPLVNMDAIELVEPRPSDDADALEAMARRLCVADGLQPDDHLYPGEPCRTRYGFMPGPNSYPAWTFYRPVAAAALDHAWNAEREAVA